MKTAVGCIFIGALLVICVYQIYAFVRDLRKKKKFKKKTAEKIKQIEEETPYEKEENQETKR